MVTLIQSSVVTSPIFHISLALEYASLSEFLLIFPIVACCFCCCRLCGNCGGKRQQLQKNTDSVCRKYTFSGILFVSTVFVMVGTICIFINNENMTTTLNNIPDTAEDNLNDVRTFVNNTVNEATHIVTENFQFVQAALYRDLDNIAFLVGLTLKTDIEDKTNITNTLTSAYSLSDSLDNADAALSAIESNKTAMETAVTDLQTALTDVTNTLDAVFTTCGANCPAVGRPDYNGSSPDIDTSAFPDLSDARTSMDDAKGTNLTEEIINGEAEVDDIPDRVVRDSNTTREDLKTTISDLSDDLEDIVDQISDVNNRISGENATIDLDKLILDIKDYKEMLETYDKYRWYGGVGLASICLLVIVFDTIGLLFGIFGTSTSTPPDQRGCISNCGGIMLMVSAALIFIFSAFLMLLTFLTFIPGAPIHKVFCEPVTDLEELERYLTIYNDQQVGEGKYFFADIVLGNDTIPLTVTDALKNCKDGQGAFTAFKLDNRFDLADMLNYSKTLDVQAEVDAINVNLSSVKIYSSSLQTQLSDLKDAVNISFTDFYTELDSNITIVNLSSLADDLDAYADLIGEATAKAGIKAEANKLRAIEAEEYAYVESNVTALNTSVAEMDAVVSNIPTMVDNLDYGLQTADDYIQNNGSDVLRSILNTYANRLLGIIDSYVAFTDDAVKNQMGSCEPVWNIYNSLLVYTFCYNLMDCFNGFWFSLGWVIFFFMPSVIFSVKLAKYFRQMDRADDGLLDSDTPPPPSANGEKNPNAGLGQEPVSQDMPSKAKFWMRNNKVSHKDNVDDCASSPIPPFPSKESRDYLEQVPSNLYEDRSFNDMGSSSHPVTFSPSTSNCVNPASSHPGSSCEEEVCNDNKSLVNDYAKLSAPEEASTHIDADNDIINITVGETSNLSDFEQHEAKPKSSDMTSSEDLEAKTPSSLDGDHKEPPTTDSKNDISPVTENEIGSDPIPPIQNNKESHILVQPKADSDSQNISVEQQVHSVPEETEKQTSSIQELDKEDTREQGFPEETIDKAVLSPSPQALLDNGETLQGSGEGLSATCREESTLTPVE
ncbi:prominin-1-A-like isoform X1 [Mercenaria mercenaria]|uniref:prominin-1-A-like isoform X1 n=2 Tax=Mercenaria mercenaria TaxID=6596 RepID=UPI00234FA0BE|nr:prominin-1-A-like isoform X1 [Mercenaria mercenaria]